MKEQGQIVKKGTLSEDGNFELWIDGKVTEREKKAEEVKADDGADANNRTATK
jgi:protein import protein ZIM17